MRRVYFMYAVILILPGCRCNSPANQNAKDRPKTKDRELILPKQTIATPPHLTFTDVTQSSGIAFRHINGAFGQKLLPETMGSGVVFFDYDKDGDPDLLFVNSCYWPGREPKNEPAPTMELYRNRGDGGFDNITKGSGLDVTFYGIGATVGDFDNDAWPDVLITGVSQNRLFRNQAGEKKSQAFADVTMTAGDLSKQEAWPPKDFWDRREPVRFSSSAAFLDYDLDGKLDLFICNYVTWSPQLDLSQGFTLSGIGRAYGPPRAFQGTHCLLYHNEGRGRFKDVSLAAGIRVTSPKSGPVGKSLGVAVCDVDSDGYPDMFVANDSVPNFLFHNQRDGSFVEIAETKGVGRPDGVARGGMGIDWGEYRPRHPGLLIGNFANEPNTLLRLDDKYRMLFSNVALAEGVSGESRTALVFGLFFFDYDFDGRLDFLSCNGHLEPDIRKSELGQSYAQAAQLYWNTGQRRRFQLVSKEFAGTDLFQPIVGRGCAYADMDGDGDLDVVLTANGGGEGRPLLLRNDAPRGKNNWIRLVLHGDGKSANTSAIGAEVTLTVGGLPPQRRTVSSSRGYLSQSEMTVTFGLGSANRVDEVQIRWPDRKRTTQTVRDLAVNQVHHIRQAARP